MGRSFYTFPDLSEAESPSHGRHRGWDCRSDSFCCGRTFSLVVPHSWGGAGQLFPAPWQSLSPAVSFRKGCGLLSLGSWALEATPQRPGWEGKGSLTIQDAVLSVTFGQGLHIPCVMEEIPLLPHSTDEESPVEPVMAWVPTLVCSLAPNFVALLSASVSHRNEEPGQTSTKAKSRRVCYHQLL